MINIQLIELHHSYLDVFSFCEPPLPPLVIEDLESYFIIQMIIFHNVP